MNPALHHQRSSAAPSLRLNVLWTLAGNIAYAACQWGVVLLATKMASVREVGAFALGTAIAAPVFLLAGMKLRAVQATDATGKYSFADYLAVRVATALLALGVVIGVGWVGAYSAEERQLIWAVGAIKSVEAVGDVLYGLEQRNERMSVIARSMILKGIASVFLFAAGILFAKSMVVATLAMGAGWLSVLLAHDVPAARATRRVHRPLGGGASEGVPSGAKWTRMATLIRTAAPLGIVVALGSLTTNIPRYILERHAGAEALGVFAALAYVLVAGNMVVNALGQTAAPRLAQHFSRGESSAFSALALRLVLLGAGLAGASLMIAVFAGPYILRTLYTEQYAVHSTVFVWLVAAQGLNYCYVFAGTVVNAMQNYRVQLPIHAASALAVLIAAAMLIPEHGIAGAAWAVMVGTVTEGALYAMVSVRLVGAWAAKRPEVDL